MGVYAREFPGGLLKLDPTFEFLTLATGSDRIPVELFQILKDDAVESAALNMQYTGSRHLLMKVKVENEKVGLKLNIQKMKIMASGPGTSWEIAGETVSDFIFLGSKITSDGDGSCEIKRGLLLGRKVMTNLDSILKKQRHYFANKGPSSPGYGFSRGHVWM